jgi:hypothetical protein
MLWVRSRQADATHCVSRGVPARTGPTAPAHPLAVAKARRLRDLFDRQAALIQHQPSVSSRRFSIALASV